MDHAIACAAFGPDQKQDVFARWSRVNFTGEFVRALHGVTVDFKDDVSGRKASIFRRACGTNAFNGRSIDIAGDIQLLTNLRRDVIDSQAEFAALVT